MNFVRHTFTFALLIALLASSAAAATYIVPDDAQLVDSSRAIVVATALGSASRFDPAGRVETLYELAIDDVIKGDVRGSTIEVAEWGGRIGDQWLVASGAPHYEPGQRYLIFLARNRWEEWTTLHLSLGCFRFARTPHGDDLLVRDDEIFGWSPSGEPHVEHARSAPHFLQFIRDTIEGSRNIGSYFAAPAKTPVTQPDAVVTPDFTGTQYCTLLGGQPTRRQTPSVVWHIWGTQPGLDLAGASSRGCAAWTNDASSNVTYGIGSAATSDVLDCFDGDSRIIGNDPRGEIPGTFSGSGEVARAVFGGSGGSHTFGGETYFTMTCADIVVQDGVGASLGQSRLDTVLTHEIGHTLGFRHSNESPGGSGCASPLPCSGSAIMNSFIVSGLGSSLQAWDRDAVATVYGSGASCTAPAISGHPSSQTIESGTAASLSVGASGTSPFTYQWYRGTRGDTTSLVGAGSSFNTGPLTATTSFWVRVTNSCGSADSNTATITVTAPCPKPQIGSQPQSSTVRTFGSRTLTVTATNASSYQWYVGSRGNTSSPTGTNSATYNTGPLSVTTSYWVRVTNSCGSVDSNTATVTVCDPVVIATQPQSQTITKGRTATLNVSTAGTSPVQYTWYQGTAPDTTLPVANANSFTTPPLNATTSYWVRATNNCGSEDSVTALITVTAACVEPAISTQPTNAAVPAGGSATLRVVATGTGLLYEWFQGNRGDSTRPVGTNSDTLTTPALTATTSYWVHITNSCGLVNSNAALVTVTSACLAPTITKQPANTYVRPGESATLTVVATGQAPLEYQWYLLDGAINTANPIGTNSPTLTTSPITETKSFLVGVSNRCGSLASDHAAVIVTSRSRAIRR